MENSKSIIMRETLRAIADRIKKANSDGKEASAWKVPEGFHYKKFNVKDVPVEHFIPKEKNSKAVILYFHGGGYVVPNGDLFRYLSIKYSKAAGGAEVFNIDYKVAPKHQYPAALEDAVQVYQYLLKEGYNNENIIVTGDSAGANLALSLTLFLKDNNIPLPKGVIVLSPWTNAANDYPAIKYNFEKDLVLGKYGASTGMNISNASYFKDADKKGDPYASPVLGDFKGFPNLLIEAGAYEMLLDDAKFLADKTEKEGVKVKFKIYDEMPHDFMIIFGQLEETKDAWNEITKFIKDNIG